MNQYGKEGWIFDLYNREIQCTYGQNRKTKCESLYIALQTNRMKDLQLHALNPKIIKLHQGLLVFFIQDFYASLTTVISCSSAKAGWALIWLRRVSAPPSRSRPLASRPSRPPPAASPRRRGRSRPAPRGGAAAPSSPSSPSSSSPVRLADVLLHFRRPNIFFERG